MAHHSLVRKQPSAVPPRNLRKLTRLANNTPLKVPSDGVKIRQRDRSQHSHARDQIVDSLWGVGTPVEQRGDLLDAHQVQVLDVRDLRQPIVPRDRLDGWDAAEERGAADEAHARGAGDGRDFEVLVSAKADEAAARERGEEEERGEAGVADFTVAAGH